MRWLAAFWLAVIALTAPLAAQEGEGRERILAFTSDVVIAKNGDYTVTETIRLVALGDQIQRGILRDFPTSYRNTLGQTTRVGFELLSVDRDGHPEPYEQGSKWNGVSIRIGDANVLLTPGEHVYVIRYRTTRQIGYRDGYDEIYWNATGNGWTFPIDMAEARITLPTPATFGARSVYTGPDGSTAKDAAVVAERPGFIHFRTTKPLDAYSGLTVAAAFPKGAIDPPSEARRLGWWIDDWGVLTAALASLFALFVYFFYAWLKVGRGPRKGTIVPIFSPPDGLSAAACRYIGKMKPDNRGFTAAVVDLAVRGHIGITRVGGTGWFSTALTSLDRKDGGGPIGAPEIAMRDALLPGIGSTIELKQDNHSTLQSANAKLNAGLKAAYDGTMFAKNSAWAATGMVAIPAAILFVAAVAFIIPAGDAAPGIMQVPLYGALALAVAWICHRLTENGGLLKLLGWIGLALSIVAAVFAAFIAIGLAVEAGGWPVFLPLIALPLAWTSFSWMYAPTRDGRATMDRIEGFRHYLGITEEERLDTLHPPEKTPELFERYLPYAIALDVENRWADRFATVLAAAAVAGTAAHTASWYSGDRDFWNDPGGFATGMGSSLASTISSASSSPSSSSSDGGSSGGGSSGGGGGGGGGSGW